MKTKPHVLVVDDEPNVRKVLGAMLKQFGYLATCAASGAEALRLVRAHDPDLVLTDLKMPEMDGIELLRKIRQEFPEIPVVLLTAHGTVETAVEAMKRGAYDFLSKPFDKPEVLEVISKALGQAERFRQDFQGPLASGERCGMVGRSPGLESLQRLIERIAPTPATVLITGETGTGKELAAEALHNLSSRSKGPFVRINCGAIPEHLVEAELFGFERGAFTGAGRSKPGRFELAHDGTLFLDEVGELPLPGQVKLLRVLQDGKLDRVGGIETRSVDVRLIAATNQDLTVMTREGRFREELLYRLKVVEVHLPALRERREDVPLLVKFFLRKHAGRLGRNVPHVSPDAVAALSGRDWPGNIRELENAVERAVLLAERPTLTEFDFGLAPADAQPIAQSGIRGAARAVAAEAERRLIRAALETTSGNVTHAASRLGISRRGLQLKMKEFGLRSSPDLH